MLMMNKTPANYGVYLYYVTFKGCQYFNILDFLGVIVSDFLDFFS